VRSLLVAALVVAPGVAVADDVAARPLVLSAGGVEVRLTAGVEIRYQVATQLLSLAPDVWWGISPRWTLGLVHSAASLDRIDPVATLCVRDPETSSCPGRYVGSGLDARFSARAGELAVAPRFRLLVRAVTPWKPAATLGALIRWSRGRFAITGDPFVRVPLANRTQGNRAALYVPVWFEVTPARGWLVFFHTGYDASFATLRDGGHVPIGLGLTAPVTDQLDLGFEAGWPSLLGPQHSVKLATVLVSLGWRR
jgi:hypothetical protein